MQSNSSASSSKHRNGSRKSRTTQDSRRAAGRRGEIRRGSSHVNTLERSPFSTGSASGRSSPPDLVSDSGSSSYGSFSALENEINLPFDAAPSSDAIDLELDMLSLNPAADPRRPRNVDYQNLSLQDIVNDHRAATNNNKNAQNVTMDRWLHDESDFRQYHFSHGGKKSKKKTKGRVA